MQNAFHNLNWLAIIVAAVSAFVLGGLWYSPLLFAKRWMKETGITEESTKNANMIKIFFLAFILALIASFFLAMFIGAKSWCRAMALLQDSWQVWAGYSPLWGSAIFLNHGP